MRFTKSKLLNTTTFRKALDEGKAAIPLYKSTIRNALEQLTLHQSEGVSSGDLISHYTWMIDKLVIFAWQDFAKLSVKTYDMELVAVGGYGRAELHPYSDVDLLILLPDEQYDDAQIFVESFLQFLWDIGLEIGHSVRSVKDSLKEARQDISTMTNMLEARHLVGNRTLLHDLDDKLRNGRIWPADKYFAEKQDEQLRRHSRFQDTAYSLEPNIKESPGGLRDLQTILWIYNRHFGVTSFKQMNEHGHINNDEYRILIRARNILWKLRAGLHLTTNRHEDRLLFDSQRELAQEFGYLDNANSLAVEQLMKRYYRTAKQVMYLNEVLLSNYRVNHIRRFSLSGSRNIDDDFALRNKLIEQRREDLFETDPQAMLKLFVLMQKNKITGIHPDTIRAIRANLELINHSFRSKTTSKKLFIELFKDEGLGLSNALSRMNAYGVLGAYLPIFGAIVGQMQHDLFHVYTVDGHTLMVIQNLIRLREHKDEYPIAGDIVSSLYRPERLFIAALFHDIAKGRGGDHSELGEVEAYQFCIEHNINEYDATLVGWLVRSHLLMSHFSQRRDISDPIVIQEFANIVGDIEHLDNLYVLTLADIKGTSPKVWNAWKGQLLLDLYKATAKALRRGEAQPLNEEEHVLQDRKSALQKLSRRLHADEYDVRFIEEFWDTLPNDYFIRNEPYYIAWHAAALCQSRSISMPIVSVRYSERLEANMIFVMAPKFGQLLSRVTASFDSLELGIIEAQMHNSNIGFALYSFKAIAPLTESADSEAYLSHLEKTLRVLILSQEAIQKIVRRKASRALKHFPIPCRVIFTFNNANHTAMEVIAEDQPGLLHNVTLILQQHSVILVSAKIATFGEKAEDIFFIQHPNKAPVVDKKLLGLIESDIIEALDREPLKTASN
jgi:[protein-PII] uridylyltransferase